ncbi:MAG: Mur ligase family protein [Hyphomicrobiales bacterium]
MPVDNDAGPFFAVVEEWRWMRSPTSCRRMRTPGRRSRILLEDVIAGNIDFGRGRRFASPGRTASRRRRRSSGHILREAGMAVQVGGNIGRGVLDLDPPAPDDAVYVLGTFLLPDGPARSLADVAVFLNLPDHLDRHGGQGYFAAKRRLFEAAAGATAVIGVDEPKGSSHTCSVV